MICLFLSRILNKNRIFQDESRDFLAVPDSSIGDLVTHSLTNYYTLLKNTTIQPSERLVTLETCDESDEET